MIERLIGWLIGWLIDWLTAWLIHLIKNPGQHARLWSAQFADARKLQDTCSWQAVNTGHSTSTAAVKGLFRVHLDQAGPLMASSGRSQHGMRWFVEVADKSPDDKIGGKFDSTAVTWQDFEPKEGYSKYADRVRTLASEMRVIRGFKQLGIRRPATDKDQAPNRPVRRLWKSSRTPRGFDFEHVEHMAQQAGLSDLEFVDKVPLRGGSVWRFKASGPATLDSYVANDRGCSKLHRQYNDHVGGFLKLDIDWSSHRELRSNVTRDHLQLEV